MSLSRPYLSVDHKEGYTQPGVGKKTETEPEKTEISVLGLLLRILMTEHQFLLRLFGHEGWIPE